MKKEGFLYYNKTADAKRSLQLTFTITKEQAEAFSKLATACNLGKGAKMKEILSYKCKVCGTEYKEKSKCKQCEEAHKTKGEIIEMRYRSCFADKSGYPDKIIVKFEDGNEQVYKR